MCWGYGCKADAPPAEGGTKREITKRYVSNESIRKRTGAVTGVQEDGGRAT